MEVLRGSITGRGRRWNQTEEQKEKEDKGRRMPSIVFGIRSRRRITECKGGAK